MPSGGCSVGNQRSVRTVNDDSREFIVLVVGALLIVDVVYELAKMWFEKKGRR